MVKLFDTTRPVTTRTNRSPSTLRLSLLAIALTGLIGCTVGPDYQAPTKLSQQLNMPQLAPATAAHDNQQLTSWWHSFADAELNRLIDTALANNQTLAAAQANVIDSATPGLDKEDGADSLTPY